MKLLRNLLGCLFFSTVIAVGFRGVNLITSSYASGFTVAKQNALLRSVKIDIMNGSWSGLIYEKNSEDGFLVLTIIHEDAMKEIVSSNFPYLLVTRESGESHFAQVVAWDSCSEVGMIKLAGNDRRYIPQVKLDTRDLSFSSPLFSFGHPLAEGVHYAEGVVSVKGTVIKECGATTDGFSGAVIPGSTGSGVYDNDGKLVGLVIATSSYPLYSQNQSGETISVGRMPIDGLGLYIGMDQIHRFLESNKLL